MDHVDEIKKRIDVVDLVSSYLTLKKAGKNFKACCPFHGEKTPSFMVSPEKQIWYCFGCNQGGDIFTFVEKMEGLDFVGAMNLLADKAGVIVEKRDFAKKGEKEKHLEMMKAASDFFSYILNQHNAGQEALKYLIEKRRLSRETVESFGLGYSPTGPDTLKKFLLKKGFKENDIMEMGLITKNSRGQIVDKFRERIMFPIRNQAGKVVAFGGRIFKEQKNPNFTPPKYMNSPQTPLYDKSSVLYGLFEGKGDIREKDIAIVVEGYLDVISSHQAGIKNVVASSGTALTSGQVNVLGRYTKNIAFCFDNDSAGQIAMKRAMEMTQFEDINVKAIVIDGAKDPDELINKNPSAWGAYCSKPIPILDFYYDFIFSLNNGAKSSDDKKKITKDFLPLVKNIQNEIERAYWVKRISQDIGVDEKYIISALSKTKSERKEGVVKKESKSMVDIPRELVLLSILVMHSQKLITFFDKIKQEDIYDERAKSIYNVLNQWHNKAEKDREELSFDLVKKMLSIPREEEVELDLLFFLTMSFFDGTENKDISEDIDELIERVAKEKKDKRKKEIEFEISKLDKAKEKETIKKLLRELQSLV